MARGESPAYYHVGVDTEEGFAFTLEAHERAFRTIATTVITEDAEVSTHSLGVLLIQRSGGDMAVQVRLHSPRLTLIGKDLQSLCLKLPTRASKKFFTLRLQQLELLLQYLMQG